MKSASQQELAAILGLSTRQVRNLEDAGMPHTVDAGRKSYPLPAAVHWWRDREVARALEPFAETGLEQERRRLVAAQAARAELQLAQERGELLRTDVVAATWAEVLTRLRARIMAIGGTWPPRLAGLDARAIAPVIREQLVPELLAELRAAGEPEEEPRA